MELGLRVGVGQTAEVFEWGPNQVLKLHYDWVPLEWVQHQLTIDRLIEVTGAPCPKVFESIELDGRIGIIYERVRGKSLVRLLETTPQATLRCGHAMATLHYKLHQLIPPYPPSLKENLHEAIFRSQSQLDPTTFTQILSRLDTLPDGQSICHGDLHPDNILMDESGNYVIVDWMNASIGHPLADVARTFLMLSSPFIPPDFGALTTVLLRTIRPLLRYTYMREYRRLSGSSMRDIRAWLPPVAAARLKEEIPGERDWLMKLISIGLKNGPVKPFT